MCSIFGAIGQRIDVDAVEAIAAHARDRGRDGGRISYMALGSVQAALGSWRAAPTTETAQAPPQPYDGICHNGTIANDAELGNPPGAVDSMVLPRVLDRSSASALAASLGAVRGSYALAVAGAETVYLASNYKPIHFYASGTTVYWSSMERHLEPVVPWGQRAARVAPYTVVDLMTGGVVPLRREHTERALVICSGGLDSTTAASLLRAQNFAVELLHFRYRCRAEDREVQRVRAIADRLRVPLTVLDIDYSQFTGGSPLLAGGEIAGGVAGAEFAHEWVPARNLLMIAHAVAYAEAHGITYVALGNNLEESGAYPDNEEEFTHLLDRALDYAVHDGGQVRLLSPVGHLMKHEIVAAGNACGTPFDLTWSCYHGGARHCGACGPCYMRREAFRRNGLDDPAFDDAGEALLTSAA